jgi:hypothetical protein
VKPKQILVLAVILLLLIVGVVIKSLQKPAELATQELTPLDLSFDAGTVGKIQISKSVPASNAQAENAITIIRNKPPEPDGWKIPDFMNARADKEKIERFLKEIHDAKGELRAKDKSLHKDFGIDGESAFRVTLFDNEWRQILGMLIGTKRAGSGNLFVRMDGSDAVYMTDAQLLTEMGIYGDPEKEKPKKEHWAALNLADFDVSKVEKLETHRFQGGKDTLAAGVMREADPADTAKKKWKFLRPEPPFALDAEKVKQFLSSINAWRASKAMDPKAKDYGLDKPQWQLKLGIEAGDEIIITAGGNTDPESKAYYLQTSRSNVVYEYPDYYFKNLDIDDSKFFVDNPLEIDHDKIERLLIVAGKQEMSFNPKAKKWDSLSNYLSELKSFSATRLLLDPSEAKKVQSPSHYRIEIQREGAPAPFILDVGEAISETPKEYAAVKRGAVPFAISEYNYKKLFDNLARLVEPKKA